MLVSVQEAAISSRTYEQHHYPGPALVSCKCLMCTDQESDVFHRFFSNWRPLVCTDTRMAFFFGFSGYFNWLSERFTGPLLWDFLFILGRSIDWHTFVRLVLNHPVFLISKIYSNYIYKLLEDCNGVFFFCYP